MTMGESPNAPSDRATSFRSAAADSDERLGDLPERLAVGDDSTA
jgi:hypothetical protein